MIRIISVVTTVWSLLFLMARLVEFRKLLVRARQHFEDDTYTISLCRDLHIKAQLGRNADICERAAMGVHIAPWQQALHQLFQKTFLCGDSPCSQVITELTSSINGLIFCILVSLGIPYVVFRYLSWRTHFEPRLPRHNLKYIKHE